ncbi:MAG: hypothetical protein EB150_09015 [Nitrososphaeria archaeon]|nr:hypothetical protein [Nitrososphaeria archaeon]
MVLLGISSSFIEDSVMKTSGVVKTGSPLELTAELDPKIGDGNGYIIVLAQEYKDARLKATLFDPSGHKKTLEVNQKTQQQFNIDDKGDYKLVLESDSTTETMAVIGLSYYPKLLEAISVLGFSMMVTGFIGVAISIVYFVTSRKKI